MGIEQLKIAWSIDSIWKSSWFGAKNSMKLVTSQESHWTSRNIKSHQESFLMNLNSMQKKLNLSGLTFTKNFSWSILMSSRKLIFKPMCHVYMGWGLCWNKKPNMEIGKLFRLEGHFCLKLKYGMPQWNLKYFPLPGRAKSVQTSSKCQNFRSWLTTNCWFQCYETIHSKTSKIRDFKD